MEELQATWNRTLELLESELNEVSYTTWVQPLTPLKIDKKKNIFYLSSNGNDYLKDILDQRYCPVIEQKLSSVYGSPLKISVLSQDDAGAQDGSSDPFFDDEFGAGTFLNPRYNFGTFVIGQNNRFAHAAALAVAESPSDAYNPLFIYGGAGLGKTHLMHAIGHFINRDNPRLKVLYVSSEMFTNELIKSIGEHKSFKFRAKYRNIDVLLIDDIQFIEKKESTQEEIFHTINTLYEANKQIIISSDRHPKDLSTLSVRLKSRFEWGLVADIQPPDYETRVAILRKKTEFEGHEINDEMSEAINLIAEKIHSNIRELEGALNRVIAHGHLLDLNIDRDLVREVLKDVFSSKENQPAPEIIKKQVCRHFNISVKDMESSKRARNYSYPRQIAMYLCRTMSDISLPKTGEFFGNRDHTTVMHACEKISEERKSNATLNDIISQLENDIRGS
jgi:chromosomal replication initiator protein